jgi:uncharacterized protein (DUF302 family)
MFDPYGRWTSSKQRGASSTALAATSPLLLIAALGLGMAMYLFSVRDPVLAQKSEAMAMAPKANNGIVCKKSNHSVGDTVEKLKSILQAKGVTIFAIIDHSGEAQKAGLNMRSTKLVIFGDPKGGTPLMLAAPSVAIDLPLKILIYEDADRTVQVCYNTPAYLQQRHNIPQDLLHNIAVVETLAAKAAE